MKRYFCPACKTDGAFFSVQAWVVISADGDVVSDEDYDWPDDAAMECMECQYQAPLGKFVQLYVDAFRADPEKEAPTALEYKDYVWVAEGDKFTTGTQCSNCGGTRWERRAQIVACLGCDAARSIVTAREQDAIFEAVRED